MITSAAKPPTVEESPFPHVPADLLEELNKRFPERCAELADSLDTIRQKAGARSVVRFLNEQYARQNENILSKKR